MILCNLKNLLTEKGTNISRVARDTGISRTTLTSLYNNACQGVQLDTVNTLCKYLNIGIENLFLFSKYDFKIRTFNMPFYDVELLPQSNAGCYDIIIEYSGREIVCLIDCVLYFHYEKNKIIWIEADFSFMDEENNANTPDEDRILRKMLEELQAPFKARLRSDIEDSISYNYNDYLIDGYELTVNFPQEFK